MKNKSCREHIVRKKRIQIRAKSLEIFFIIGEKEDLWSLAKRTNLSCQALLEQNPNLENGCTPGERIVVYRHENISL